MDTWVKVVLGGAVAYFAYEMFYGSASTTAPASWTNAGGTAAQWAALSATGQANWNATAAASQSAANVAYFVQAYPVIAAVVPAASATGGNPTPPPVGGMTLAQLATAIQNAAAADPNQVSGAMSGDHWNYYANLLTGQTFPAAFPAGPLTFSAYWSAQSPVIAAQTGMGSIMDGLGALIRNGRIVGGSNAGMGAYVQQSEQYAFASDAAGPMTPFFFDADTALRSWN